jgi:hypothetical protein
MAVHLKKELTLIKETILILLNSSSITTETIHLNECLKSRQSFNHTIQGNYKVRAVKKRKAVICINPQATQ